MHVHEPATVTMGATATELPAAAESARAAEHAYWSRSEEMVQQQLTGAGEYKQGLGGMNESQRARRGKYMYTTTNLYVL